MKTPWKVAIAVVVVLVAAAFIMPAVAHVKSMQQENMELKRQLATRQSHTGNSPAALTP